MIAIDKLSDISVEDFYSIYLDGNKPCIFESKFTANWKCINHWRNENSKFNFANIFQYNSSNDKMHVADCNSNYFDSHMKSEMAVDEFLTYWEKFHDFTDQRLLYLKDWHYFLRRSDAADSFILLPHFSRDWLNEFFDMRNDIVDDYRFVYVGVKGTWTGLHVDVFQSYSWSANIVGEKRWVLFPPEHAAIGRTGETDIRNVPGWQNVPHIELIQKAGEIIFVPSGWLHQVENVTDCVSVNHNWINRYNIAAAWRYLCSQLDDVERETDDVKHTPGYVDQCQCCLKAYSGMNFEEFIVMVECIIYKRCNSIIGRLKGVPLVELSSSDNADISSMRQFFERILCRDLFLFKHLSGEDSYLDWCDIGTALRVLQLIASDPRCRMLGLISPSVESFVASGLDLFQHGK